MREERTGDPTTGDERSNTDADEQGVLLDCCLEGSTENAATDKLIQLRPAQDALDTAKSDQQRAIDDQAVTVSHETEVVAH